MGVSLAFSPSGDQTRIVGRWNGASDATASVTPVTLTDFVFEGDRALVQAAFTAEALVTGEQASRVRVEATVDGRTVLLLERHTETVEPVDFLTVCARRVEINPGDRVLVTLQQVAGGGQTMLLAGAAFFLLDQTPEGYFTAPELAPDPAPDPEPTPEPTPGPDPVSVPDDEDLSAP